MSMGFKKLMASMGAGGASVETVLNEPNVVPGGVVQGEVRIQGGSVAQQIEGLSVGLQARVEVETDDGEYKQNVEFHRQQVGGAFEVQPGAVHAVQFGMEVPWETPITMFMGRQLTGMNVGVVTELQIARAVDSGDLERGHIRGTRQRLPFYQEIEFFAPEQYRGLNQVEVSFVADDREMDVILEMDKKPGLFTEGSDSYRAFRVGHANFQETDWTAYLNQWLSEVGGKRNWF
jgi:sporulation-control protein